MLGIFQRYLQLPGLNFLWAPIEVSLRTLDEAQQIRRDNEIKLRDIKPREVTGLECVLLSSSAITAWSVMDENEYALNKK